MAFLLVLLAFFSIAGATVPYKTAYLEQNLDHFNFVQDKTFKQRYLYTGKSLSVAEMFKPICVDLNFYIERQLNN